MGRFAAFFGGVLCLLASAAAQERHATVTTLAGRTVAGRVVAMNLEAIELEVDGATIRIPATDMRSCRFAPAGEQPAGEQPAGESHGDDVPADVPPAVQEPTGGSAAAAAGPAGAGAGGTTAPDPAAPPPARKSPQVSWTRPLPDPVDPTSTASLPFDLRHRSLLRARIAALDEAYPWLAPAAPTQWLSLGLLLLVAMGLVVHLSVHVAGAEAPRLGRSVGLGVWYLLTGALQVAAVPVHDLSITLMLLGNTAVSLFWLCALFGLPRFGAIVAVLVQLGFAVLVYGVLELVTALLGSVGVTT